MKRNWSYWIFPVFGLFLILGSGGCAEPGRHEVAGTVAGGALGAGTGAIIGHQVGHTGAGTAIGAGAGALAGNVIGRGIDEAARTNERTSPSGYTYPPAGTSSNTYIPPGAPPPPPPPGHYEWNPNARQWVWHYDQAY